MYITVVTVAVAAVVILLLLLFLNCCQSAASFMLVHRFYWPLFYHSWKNYYSLT